MIAGSWLALATTLSLVPHTEQNRKLDQYLQRMNEPFVGECVCIRLLSLTLKNANAVLHLRQRFLRTHKTGQLGDIQ